MWGESGATYKGQLFLPRIKLCTDSRWGATPPPAAGDASDEGGDAIGLGELAAVVRSSFRPHLVLAGGPEGATRPPLIRDRTAAGGRATAYVCENFTCELPVTAAEDLRRKLASAEFQPL